MRLERAADEAHGRGPGAVLLQAVDPGLLDPRVVYIVALTLDPSATPVVWSPATTLVWQQPALTSVAVVNQSIELGWTLPAATTIAAVTASIYDSTTMSVVANGTFSGNGARLQLATPLDPAHSYKVSVAGTNGVASSAAVSSPTGNGGIICDKDCIQAAPSAHAGGIRSPIL